MSKYGTHNCNSLSLADAGHSVIITGWIHKKRDHGGMMFVDLRDHYGITQVVLPSTLADLLNRENVRLESIIRVDGLVVPRPEGTKNTKLETGEIELVVNALEIVSKADELPIPVGNFDPESPYPEEMRLKYRFLDLRRPDLHRNITLRSDVIDTLRGQMKKHGFREYQTPILTASSPEGARDFLVPSRLHPGKFYALPQAPQQFKQLLMVSGFDKYFQIAPCFRDESSRSDRSPGEFYQLDLEMSFVEQEDVFQLTSDVVYQTFAKHSAEGTVVYHPSEWPRIPYREAISRFGSDKPDLRNPLEFVDVTESFRCSHFKIFADMIAQDPEVRIWGIKAPNFSGGKFAKKMNDWAISEGQPGLAMIYPTVENGHSGPIIKAIGKDGIYNEICSTLGINTEDGAAFVAGKPSEMYKFAGLVRTKLAEELMPEVFDKQFKFCWIVDFPMYELDDNGRVAFSHNPFSMPQGGMEALTTKDPLDILAFQYDLVCNGIELSSGAIRNHEPETMIKAFEIAGYTREEVEKNFSGMINAFRFGAPPHGGIAPGVDRIVMLLAGATNIREVIAFPLDSQGRDLMMNAPNEVTPEQLKELRIKPI